VPYFTPSGRVLSWITAVHRGLYRATGGVIGSRLPQIEQTSRGIELRALTVLLLTTRGRKSAMSRTVPLPCFVYEGRTFLVASNAGTDRHPAWYLNLLQEPEVFVQLRSQQLRYRAVAATGAERERLWRALADDWPRYRLYQAGTTRQIPLVELVAV
jgi:deazaflavin-dependent oxidoreductase (nitroreductase family)